MNTDIIEGNWEQLKGEAQSQWGELTNDDLDEAAGNVKVLVGKVQERYGISKDEAVKQVNKWLVDCQ